MKFERVIKEEAPIEIVANPENGTDGVKAFKVFDPRSKKTVGPFSYADLANSDFKREYALLTKIRTDMSKKNLWQKLSKDNTQTWDISRLADGTLVIKGEDGTVLASYKNV